MGAMDRIEDLLHFIRNPRRFADVLLGAPAGHAAAARRLAAVPSSLPAVHRELGGEPGRLAIA